MGDLSLADDTSYNGGFSVALCLLPPLLLVCQPIDFLAVVVVPPLKKNLPSKIPCLVKCFVKSIKISVGYL